MRPRQRARRASRQRRLTLGFLLLGQVARARAAAVAAIAATVSACVIGGVAGRRHQPRNQLFAQRVRVGE